jgi:UDP-glucose 4-epimerase
VRLAFVTVFRRATKVPAILTPKKFDAMLKPLRFDDRKLRETLGWKPPLDYRQCLARTYGPESSRAEAPVPWSSGTAAST